MDCVKWIFSGFRRCCCPCCVKRGAREYLRILEGTYPVTQQLLEDVENFDIIDCIKYLHIMQRDNVYVMWIPSICARILILYYEEPDSVELYLPQICHLLLAFDEVCHSICKLFISILRLDGTHRLRAKPESLFQLSFQTCPPPAFQPCLPLEVAVLHLCTRSLHLTLLVYWFLFSAVRDPSPLSSPCLPFPSRPCPVPTSLSRRSLSHSPRLQPVAPPLPRL